MCATVAASSGGLRRRFAGPYAVFALLGVWGISAAVDTREISRRRIEADAQVLEEEPRLMRREAASGGDVQPIDNVTKDITKDLPELPVEARPEGPTESKAKELVTSKTIVRCEWEEWGAWAKCSASCGGGFTTRWRKKRSDGGRDMSTADCDGEPREKVMCNPHSCDVVDEENQVEVDTGDKKNADELRNMPTAAAIVAAAAAHADEVVARLPGGDAAQVKLTPEGFEAAAREAKDTKAEIDEKDPPPPEPPKGFNADVVKPADVEEASKAAKKLKQDAAAAQAEEIAAYTNKTKGR